MKMSSALVFAVLAASSFGCNEEPAATTGGTPSASAQAAPPPPTQTASVAAPAPTPSVKPHDCPPGSSGEGSLTKPCEAKGKERMMEVTWTGKMTDTGPSFRVVNTSKQVILYGKIDVYFYDKAGKQLEVKDATGAKPRPSQPCSGNMFSGVMKAGEKAVITFSCVDKKSVPDGAVAVEAEMQTVGFSDDAGTKVEYYWRNNDLVPDVRPKGGVK